MRCFVSFLMLISFALCSPVHSEAESEQQLNAEAMGTLEKAITFLEGMDRFEIKGSTIFDVVQKNGQRFRLLKGVSNDSILVHLHHNISLHLCHVDT